MDQKIEKTVFPQICDACARPGATISMGSAILCRRCAPIVKQKIDRLHADKKPVNVVHIAKRIFRENYGTNQVLQIRDIPEQLRERMGRTALDEKTSIRKLVLKALYRYVENQ